MKRVRAGGAGPSSRCSRSGEVERYKPVGDPDACLLGGPFVVPDENPAALRLDRSAHPHLQLRLTRLHGARFGRAGFRPDFDDDGTAGNERAVHHQAKRPPVAVLAQQHHGAVEIRIDKLRHRQQERGREGG